MRFCIPNTNNGHPNGFENPTWLFPLWPIFFRWPAGSMVDLIRATAMYLCSYCRHFMVLIPLESRGKNLFIHVYKSKWPKISLSRVLTQPEMGSTPATEWRNSEQWTNEQRAQHSTLQKEIKEAKLHDAWHKTTMDVTASFHTIKHVRASE
jgi:hypothetical protein